MKSYKAFLHVIITLGSVFAFLTGWASLAHSLKPVQPVQKQVISQLPPLPPVGQVDLNNSSGGTYQSYTPSNNSNYYQPSFMTRGS
jgi:hypothetical protein